MAQRAAERALVSQNQQDGQYSIGANIEIAQSVGVSVKELIDSGIRAKTGTVAVQYRYPNDASQQWTGRGRQPKWVKKWIESGKY